MYNYDMFKNAYRCKYIIILMIKEFLMKFKMSLKSGDYLKSLSSLFILAVRRLKPSVPIL
jgi:hypothetical protein